MNFSKRLNEIKEYYFSKKLEEVRQLEARGKRIINLGIGSPDMAPSEETIKSLIASAENPKNHAYQSYRSIIELRIAISKWYIRTFGIASDPVKEILPLLGSKEGVFYLSMALLDEGDEVLIPNPGYPAYSSAAKIAGGKVRYYDLKEEIGWYPDLSELENMDLSKVKLVWVNYPNMPTGARANKEVLRQLAEFGLKHDIIICNDNPYSMVLNDEQISIMEFDTDKRVCIELNSMSKSFNMAGWRIGMMIAGEEIINAVLQIKSNVDSGMFRPLQDAAIAAFENDSSWHELRNKEYRERRELVFKMLDIMAFTYDPLQVGMFVWAKSPDYISNIEEYLDSILYNAGVFLTPGKIFGSNGERFIRVSLCSSKENIEEAMRRIMESENFKMGINN
ncbi:MAG: aminotransferase class I/II-fold pyridoxal phosphate-dependent enzyme [Bacteroidota bacterium]|nr:aminotransferase class I/II-fold pyridoxal phosphate-dependent enzyme [Bacteroidota bacterium]